MQVEPNLPRTGVIGILASAAGVTVSHLDRIETWLRVLTTAGGFVVTMLTIISLWRGLRKKKKEQK